MQKQEKRRELRLKRFWRSPKTTSSEDSTGCESPQRIKATTINDRPTRYNHLYYTSLTQNSAGRATSIDMLEGSAAVIGNPIENKPTCSLPLLQVWLSQPLLKQEGFLHLRRNSGPEGQRDSPRGEADGQSFVFPVIAETSTNISNTYKDGSDVNISPVGATGIILTSSTSGLSNNNNCYNSNSRAGNNLTLHTLGVQRNLLYCDTVQAGGDSGIDSVQASPSPNALPPPPDSPAIGENHSIGVVGLEGDVIVNRSRNVSSDTTPLGSFSPNLTSKAGKRMNGSRANISIGSASNYRRKSSTLLHPDHARLFALRMKRSAALERSQTSPDQTSIEDATEFIDNGLATNLRICSASSSTTSSLTSVGAVSLGGGAGSMTGHPAAVGAQQRVSDPWLQPQSDRERDSRHERRRSSTMTARYSLFNALDLEYALLKAAARGSVGPYSLSESMHKLTFTQSLAFPALARGLASKRRRSATCTSTRPLNPNESGLNTCAKVVTAVILVVISFMVFLIVYKFVRT